MTDTSRALATMLQNPAPATKFVDVMLRADSDRHKPTFAQLRDEGVSDDAVVALFAGRDAIANWQPARVANLLAHIQRTHPFGVADVFPSGKPLHWRHEDALRESGVAR